LAPLEEHFGREAAAGLVELNGALPPDQAVVFVAFPIPLGSDLLLHRLFAKRPFAVLPDLRFLPEWRARNAPRPVVVTIGEQRSPDGAEVVATRGAMSAWRPRT
jgi:hypothetical protein